MIVARRIFLVSFADGHAWKCLLQKCFCELLFVVIMWEGPLVFAWTQKLFPSLKINLATEQRWIWCSAVALTFIHHTTFVSSCCHTVCPKHLQYGPDIIGRKSNLKEQLVVTTSVCVDVYYLEGDWPLPLCHALPTDKARTPEAKFWTQSTK
jgi:hypothetical protein